MRYKLATIIILSVLLFTSCNCEFYGSHDLGNNFTLLEGDKLEDRAIVFCSPKKENKCCNGGSYVIPTYENHYNDEGRYTEYVETAKSNENWIIAKSILVEDKTAQFWIIDKNFILDTKYEDWPLSEENGKYFSEFVQSRVAGPLDATTFKRKVKELNINLKFE